MEASLKRLATDRIDRSARWKAMVGCAEHEIGTSPDEWFRRVHAMDVERVRAASQEALRDAQRRASTELVLYRRAQIERHADHRSRR